VTLKSQNLTSEPSFDSPEPPNATEFTRRRVSQWGHPQTRWLQKRIQLHEKPRSGGRVQRVVGRPRPPKTPPPSGSAAWGRPLTPPATRTCPCAVWPAPQLPPSPPAC